MHLQLCFIFSIEMYARVTDSLLNIILMIYDILRTYDCVSQKSLQSVSEDGISNIDIYEIATMYSKILSNKGCTKFVKNNPEQHALPE